MSMIESTERKREDKTGLVTAAVIFATEDHATTYRKGGTQLLDGLVYASPTKQSIRQELRTDARCRAWAISHQDIRR